MQQGWYEDFIEKFQFPELDPSNLNFMQRRQLFLSEDGAEFTTDLVTLIGRLHIDIGKISKKEQRVFCNLFHFLYIPRVNHVWNNPWR